jgi:response regulator RpfG family c-di-GMP phosphodiesterase
LAALHNIDMAITASLDLNFTLNVMLEQVINQLNVDAAAVLLNHKSQVLKYAAGRGFRSTAIERTQVRLGDEYAGQSALTRRMIHVPRLNQVDPSFKRLASLADEDYQTYYVVPLVAKGEVMGVLELFHREALTPDIEWTNFLETLAGQAAIAIHNTERLDNLELSKTELDVAYAATLEAWVHAQNLREGTPVDHTSTIVDLTLNLVRAMDISQNKLTHIARGAMLHDIGNMGIPEKILRKGGPLTEEERAIVEGHPQYAYTLLSAITYLEPSLIIPYCHHERWDGSGYPRGLKGEEIPPEARAFAVVDVWTALTMDRPFRRAWPRVKARSFLEDQAGILFDPRVVELFFRYLKP